MLRSVQRDLNCESVWDGCFGVNGRVFSLRLLCSGKSPKQRASDGRTRVLLSRGVLLSNGAMESTLLYAKIARAGNPMRIMREIAV
jgi:hypothetical protein